MWPFTKKSKESYTFAESDRQLSLESRRLKREMENARQEMALEKQKFELEKLRLEIEQQKAEMYDDDEPEESGNNMEQMLMGILGASMMNKQPSQPIQPVQQTTELSDDEIKTIISQFKPAQVAMFKKLPQETQVNLIKAQMPNIGNDTIQRALRFL